MDLGLTLCKYINNCSRAPAWVHVKRQVHTRKKQSRTAYSWNKYAKAVHMSETTNLPIAG